MPELSTHTFVLKIADRPGAMELVAATFAQRGVSLSTLLGTDNSLSVQGRGTVLLTFTATLAKKEVLRRALQRLSRVESLVEYTSDSPLLRKTAVLRLKAEAPAPALPSGVVGLVERLGDDSETNEVIYLLVGQPLIVDSILKSAQVAGNLCDVTHTIIALS